MATISRSGSAKSVVMPSVTSQHDKERSNNPVPLHLWVLNTFVTYTSSVTNSRRAALKILHKDIEWEEADKLLESLALNTQEIVLPASSIQATRQILRSSTSMLPDRDRTFQGWAVGLLDIWTECIEGNT